MKKLPSSLTAGHSALFSHLKTTTRMMDAASLHCSGTTCHAIKSPLPIPLPLSPDPFLCCSIKQCAAKKTERIGCDLMFHCDLPLTIFMNSMLSSNFNLFWHISLHRSIFDLPLTLVPIVLLFPTRRFEKR